MIYDELMKSLTIQRAYPINGPVMKSRKNIQGNSYKFQATHVRIMGRNRIIVQGQTHSQVWCSLEYSFKSMPKWLKEELKLLAKGG